MPGALNPQKMFSGKEKKKLWFMSVMEAHRLLLFTVKQIGK